MTTYARRLGLFSATRAVVGEIFGGGTFRTAVIGTTLLLLDIPVYL